MSLLLIFSVQLSLAAPRLLDIQKIFDEAVELDLGGAANATSAFALYREAAKKGLSAAEFNVAVMLDAGRGVEVDERQAATWYAKSASRGNQRAAFNLGQLYEAGVGVPRNPGLAKAWFDYSNLPAGRERSAHLSPSPKILKPFAAPVCGNPSRDAMLSPMLDGVELVWTSVEQPVPVSFFVEVYDISGKEVYSQLTRVSSVLVQLPVQEGQFIWRVSVVASRQARYIACDWISFTLHPERD